MFTREQILLASNEQLNTWCAELIMGWHTKPHAFVSYEMVWIGDDNDKDDWRSFKWFVKQQNDKLNPFAELPSLYEDKDVYYIPSRDIAQAFALLDHLNATRQWECHASFLPDDLLWQGNGNRYVATVWAYGKNRHTRSFEMGGNTLPLAIVKACLLAVSYADGGTP